LRLRVAPGACLKGLAGAWWDDPGSILDHSRRGGEDQKGQNEFMRTEDKPNDRRLNYLKTLRESLSI
jgi:hypothetical protein